MALMILCEQLYSADAAEYGATMLLFWRWLRCISVDDRDGDENRAAPLSRAPAHSGCFLGLCLRAEC